MTYDLAIIGAGSAGLTAAIYGVRFGMSTIVFESSVHGGQIVNALGIENYPGMPGVSGTQYAMALYGQATGLGAKVQYEQVLDVNLSEGEKVLTTASGTYQAKTVIIATGARNRKLEAVGEDDFVGRGMSYCATCDGNFFRGKDVAVVGGGNTAIDDLIFLSNVVNHVYLIHRRDGFRAAPSTLQQAKKLKNTTFLLGRRVSEVYGDERVQGIKLIDTATDLKAEDLKVDGVFAAVGQLPQTQMFKGTLDLTPEGYFAAAEDCTTNIPGVFVAGDNRAKKVRQLVTAASDGAVAATMAAEWLLGTGV